MGEAEFTRASLIKAMERCYQTPAQSVLQHGQSVWLSFQSLIDHLKSQKEIPAWWRIPKWAYQPGILERLYPMPILAEYAIYHDCGKVTTRVIGDDGKIHFPGHAAASERLWLGIGGHSQAARLMGMDMDAHLLSPETIPEFASRPEAISLLLMAIAETHSNALMFGGTDSDSFKIKMKKLDKRGGQAVTQLLTQTEIYHV
jgi:hypothetical protein